MRSLVIPFALVALIVSNCWSFAGQVRRETVPSLALGGDLSYAVYVPDGYEGSRARYPVLYLLHGAGGDFTEWTDVVHIQNVADLLIAEGKIPPSLIVMPECRGCWWIDSPRAKIETAFWVDLVPGIARRYRVIDKREGRAVAGFSAGGFGAVRMALKYPDKFAAAAAFSPAIYSDIPPLQSLARSQLPFRTPAGAFNPTLWRSANYPALIEGYRSQTQRVPLFLTSGDHDKLGIAFETALFFKTLFDIQPEQVELRVVDGGHSAEVCATVFPDALAYMSRFLQPPTTLTAGAPQVAPVVQ